MGVDVHVLVQCLERQLRARVGEIPCVLHDGLDLFIQLLQLLVSQLAALPNMTRSVLALDDLIHLNFLRLVKQS